ncbi:NAD-dependent epimerase/dehydratase family protein [Peristeroidobacter agariperforans]|uniref:NAD-dependent epimerase/dehydratase family protein n=1 Tax=Peristeroidobacter agariperforans TaxID=268404 RepID=UPI00101CC3C0|nr:NAD-dependent epimerase/dehydratase family protein [Peristeroidobacter agariperforans]
MSDTPVVAVTGANGYVGSIICRALTSHAHIIPLVRVPRRPGEEAWSFGASEDMVAGLLSRNGVTHIVHAAWDMKRSDLTHLKQTCVAGTERLVVAARMLGISNFILISSMSAFSGTRSAYGQSKLLAEQGVFDGGGTVLRLGLVWGDSPGGVFGSLSTFASRLPIVPIIVGGAGMQFLLHERSLTTAIIRAVQGDFAGEQRAITLAHPMPIALSKLLRALVAAKGRRAIFVPVPWHAPYLVLRCAERLHVPLKLRSDNLLGFIYQDTQPDFTPLAKYRIDMEPFPPGADLG